MSMEESKARDPIWQRDHADAEPAPQAEDEAVPMVPEADLDAAVALAEETEHELRLELERLNAAVLAFAHPLGVARNLAPLEALHCAQRALKAQQERDRDEAQLRQQEIADRDRALAELDPAALAEARRVIEELQREVGAAKRKVLRHESLIYELSAFVAYTGYSTDEGEGEGPEQDPDPEDA